MEAIIRLSGCAADVNQIKRKLVCLLWVILLMTGLSLTAEKYRETNAKSDIARGSHKEPSASGGTKETNLSAEKILPTEHASNLANGVGRINLWKTLELTVPAESSRTAETATAETADIPAVPDTSLEVVPEAVPDTLPGAVSETVPETAPDKPEETPAPAVLTVNLHGNGGEPAVTTLTETWDAVVPDAWTAPFRPGKVFDGWYLDEECTMPFTVVEEGTEILNLYAGWRELDGFVSDDEGHIISCAAGGNIVDGILALPSDAACTGIESGALNAVAELVVEIYIPANIMYIGEGAFDGLPNLMYIEAEPGNPNYYSEGGILYTSSGEIAASPVWYEEGIS